MAGEQSAGQSTGQEHPSQPVALWPGWPCWLTMALGLLAGDNSMLASSIDTWHISAPAGAVVGLIYILLVPLLGAWLKPLLFAVVGFLAGCVWVPLHSVPTNEEQMAPVLAIVLLYVPFVALLTLAEILRAPANDDATAELPSAENSTEPEASTTAATGPTAVATQDAPTTSSPADGQESAG